MRSTNAPFQGFCKSLAESATTLSAIVLFASCVPLVCAQQPTGPQSPPRSPNDPSILRQGGYSLQQSSTIPTNANSLPAQAGVVQPTGLRVFPQPTQATDHSPSQQDRLTARASGVGASGLSQTGVQQANWASESSSARVESAKARTPIELRSRSKEASSSVDEPKSNWAAALSLFFSLTLVISLFLFIAWLFRKSQPNTFQKLPTGVLQVLGRTAMAPRQHVYVVRFGNKMLLVSHQPGQTQTLGEITDADEVDRLAALCESNQPTSVTHSFREVLRQVASGRSDTESPPNARKRTSLSRSTG